MKTLIKNTSLGLMIGGALVILVAGIIGLNDSTAENGALLLIGAAIIKTIVS